MPGRIPGMKSGFNTFMSDVHTALGHMWGASKAGVRGMIRGEGLGGISAYVGSAPDVAGARAKYRSKVRSAALDIRDSVGDVWKKYRRGPYSTRPYIRKAAAAEKQAWMSAKAAMPAYRLRQYGSYGAYVAAGIGAIRLFGGDDIFETAGGVGGFALGYSRYAGRRPSGRYGGGLRGIGAGMVGSAIGRWIL